MAVRDVEGVERTNYPITATILPGQKLRLRLTFEEPRFARDSMRRVLDQWRLALLSLAAPETRSLADVTMMDAEERFLTSRFGDEYDAYRARSARLWPGVY